MADSTEQTLAKIAAKVDAEGGRLSIAAYPPNATRADGDTRWMVGVEWGEEEPGSEMYAGASYGMQETLEDALDQICQEMGL